MVLIDEDKIKNDVKKGVPVIKYGVKKITGSWSINKPVCDKKKCIGCGTCWIKCPDSAITLGKDDKPIFDYDVCKGCLVCVFNCPVKAIGVEKKK